MEGASEQVATQFKQLAEMYFEKGDVSNACFYYINCLKVAPELKNELKSRFVLALCHLGQELESRGLVEEIFTMYEEALKVYDDCEVIYHNLGAHLLRLGYADRAASAFREAIKINQNYFPAYHSLHSSHCALVERWHYRMLNDTVRNEAFRVAIMKKLHEGYNSVLDIGTGTGLFCLYALQGGAQKVYGCDYGNPMISIASRVLNNFGPSAEKVKLFEKHSNHLTVPNDIPERVSLVVTETMDSCMLGEHLLETLQYAWQHLLLPPRNSESTSVQPSGAVIPYSGGLWFTLVQSTQIARKYMYPVSSTDAEDCANALANISLESSIPENFKSLLFPNLFVKLDEPYDTERLQTLPDCTFLTEPHELFHINFNCPEQIEKYLRGKNLTSFEVTCTTGGFFHAIVAWFRVHVDSDIILSSAPDDLNARNCCWDQAVFPFTRELQVEPGCKVSLSAGLVEGRVVFNAHHVTYPNGLMLKIRSLTVNAPSSFVLMMNDTNLLEHLKIAAITFLQNFKGKQKLRILDTYPVPVFALTVLQNIHHLTNLHPNEVQLVCVIESDVAVEPILRIADYNRIPKQCISLVLEDDFDGMITQLPNEYFDAIMLNLLDKEGDLNLRTIGHIRLLKSRMEVNGVLFPKKVEVCSQLVHSDYIERNMRVVDGDICRLGIGEAINEYQVSQMVEMNLNSLICEKYSSPFTAHQFSVDDFDSEFSKEFFVPVCRRGSVNSVVYWFNVYFYVGEQCCYSTLDDFSYVHQAAFLTKSPIVYQQNDNAVVQFVYHHGTFIIILKSCDNCSF